MRPKMNVFRVNVTVPDYRNSMLLHLLRVGTTGCLNWLTAHIEQLIGGWIRFRIPNVREIFKYSGSVFDKG
jgi:hypothetical protein